MKRIWLSHDVEATGPVPGLHSMLSIGLVALLEHTPMHGESAVWFERIGTFTRNLRPLGDAGWDVDTFSWWNHPDREAAYKATTQNPSEPVDAMRAMMDFLESLPRWPHVWAAYPATFDMPFVNYYATRFVRDWWFDFYRGNPMERVACFDMGSYAMHLLNCGFHDVSKKRMPEPWTRHHNPLPHTALNDAEEQAHLLIHMLQHGRDLDTLHHPAMR